MIYSVFNTAASARVFYNVNQQEVTLAPGVMRHVDLSDETYMQLAARQDLIIKPFSREVSMPPPRPVIFTDKPPAFVTGHYGIGDALHQRAVMRELMKSYDVWLHTCHCELYHDLIDQGLKLILRPTQLHAQYQTMMRERHLFAQFPQPPANARKFNIGYPAQAVHAHGSILEAMFSHIGQKMPDKPDFSLPIKPEWTEAVRDKYLSRWDLGGKPLLIHRPIVIRREWDGRARNPDPAAYDALFRSIRDRFFVVSVAYLVPNVEWIDGPQQDADVKLHNGELTFPEMAALWAEADLIYCNAGFAPVLAQATGTPFIVVYGGRESFRTTERIGTHLAPTCPIQPINPCDCHTANHACDKRIDVPKALQTVAQFIEDVPRDTLLFGTFYVDSPDRDQLTELWKKLHLTLNGRDCDFLAVDSQSPIKKFEDWTPYDGKRHKRSYFNFPDNIGHLSRRSVTQGRDGWGRAFCKGLEIACELGYRYVAHIEGDSLFRLRVADVVRQMKAEGIDCASTDVRGMKAKVLETQWIETGLMFFSTDYIKRSDFINRYDWPRRQVTPTPERWIRLNILQKDLNDKQLKIMPWKAWRADKNEITKDTIAQLDLDWVTHQHDSAQQGVYSKFVEMALAGKEVMQNQNRPGSRFALGQPEHKTLPQPLLKLNLGCGNNKIPGWENHDADVDIKVKLPWPDNSASHIFIEHCVEHVPYKSAIQFFYDAYRVLAPGGVLRVTVPSFEQIAKCNELDYFKFTMQWQKLGPTKRGAMSAIAFAHGHEMIWNAQLLHDALYLAGFDNVSFEKPGQSSDPVLRGVEGHGRVISDKFNNIESCVCEAHKAGRLSDGLATGTKVAVVIGGAEGWQMDLEAAKGLLNGHDVRYFIINDHIKTFSEPAVCCTLHPDKLNGLDNWLGRRQQAGLPPPLQVWSHRKHPAVTNDTASLEWLGSSGLFAVQVARLEGYRKIIGCGVPMTVDGGHFERHQHWQSAIKFREGWVRYKHEIVNCFRSMSGWTMETFGGPDEKWLGET